MDFNATDTTAQVIKRLQLANNGYAITYSETAAKGAENMGYRITAASDFQGDSMYYVYKKR